MKNRKNRISIPMLLALVLLIALAVNVVTTSANAEEEKASSEIRKQIEEMQKDRDKIDAQIRELESQLADNLSEMEAIVAQKNIIDQEIFLLHEQVANTNEMISAYNVLIADKQKELNEAQERLDTLNEQNKERIRAMEEDGSLSYWSVLFKANSFSDLLDRLNMIEEIAISDQRRLEEMREAAAVVAAAQAELQAEKANLELVKEDLAATEENLLVKRAEADDLLNQLIATGEEYERYIEEREMAGYELDEEIIGKQEELESALTSESIEASIEASIEESIQESIEESIQESIEESRRQEEATRVTEETNYSEPDDDGWESEVTSSGWRSPLTHSSWVTSPYGMRLHPVHGDWRMHHGVDLESDLGDEIVAARAGKVIKAKYQDGGAGWYVTLDHGDGFTSTYMHMTHFVVSVGQYVEQGQLLGYVGSTGASTGPHLHFGIYYNGESKNPCNYVDFS